MRRERPTGKKFPKIFSFAYSEHLSSDAPAGHFCYFTSVFRLSSSSSWNTLSSSSGTDGINGQTAFIYVCPIAISGNVTGYLLSYMNPDNMKEFFDNSVYGDKAFFSLFHSVPRIGKWQMILPTPSSLTWRNSSTILYMVTRHFSLCSTRYRGLENDRWSCLHRLP